ncbi:hypothetical protein MJO28_012458 [Puccinia striiformis f. sp. tritici]|uniref:Uncharacterized protein n=1 Tax=Puccinia striiformis f. sp. tritici TaxID=168172 RepID=A0ACC0E172_9BASI|nr:hypothetical protein Pst134EA_022640 [Puccinia striiformis f. sp. tritici]KAH9445687.1 hypothetical protein Pst134EB_023523 [Puccinia striiformis f. sp. tritici]KAH9455162.1 hypothetical protein Pst134EA_022640 [Puccinia striiformis f. sp. tritici]KAI7942431.1 hypothetical protein MJO28_012458 [Puccinia striiformis f. sp. tritici]KAI7945572.1 hypothetical protein MJO29_011960 [Puccinia striiformis f. sp. tritici]
MHLSTFKIAILITLGHIQAVYTQDGDISTPFSCIHPKNPKMVLPLCIRRPIPSDNNKFMYAYGFGAVDYIVKIGKTNNKEKTCKDVEINGSPPEERLCCDLPKKPEDAEPYVTYALKEACFSPDGKPVSEFKPPS